MSSDGKSLVWLSLIIGIIAGWHSGDWSGGMHLSLFLIVGHAIDYPLKTTYRFFRKFAPKLNPG